MKKSKKILVIGIVVLFIISAIFNTIVSCNVQHHRHCKVVDCSVCALIELATVISKNAITFVGCLAFLAIIYSVLKKTKIYINNVEKETLVDLKIVNIN